MIKLVKEDFLSETIFFKKKDFSFFSIFSFYSFLHVSLLMYMKMYLKYKIVKLFDN